MSIYSGNPCRDCEGRHPGCHGECEDYKGWREGVDQKKDMVYQDRKKHEITRSYVVDMVNANRKRNGKPMLEDNKKR